MNKVDMNSASMDLADMASRTAVNLAVVADADDPRSNRIRRTRCSMGDGSLQDFTSTNSGPRGGELGHSTTSAMAAAEHRVGKSGAPPGGSSLLSLEPGITVTDAPLSATLPNRADGVSGRLSSTVSVPTKFHRWAWFLLHVRELEVQATRLELY